MKIWQKMKYKKTGGVLALFLILTGLFFTGAILQGQNARASAMNSRIWALWRKGFEDFENAELKMISRKYPDAIAHYTAALDSFRKVRQLNPKWNKDVIEYRISRAERRIEVAKEKIRSSLPPSARRAMTATSSSSGDFARARQKLDAENAALKKQLEDARKSITAARVQAASHQAAAHQVKSLLAEREKLEKEIALLKLKFDNLEKLRLSTHKEQDKLLLQEKARSSSLASVIREQNKEMLDLRKKLQAVSFDKSTLDTRIRQLQKAAEEERSLAALQLKQEKGNSETLQKKLRQNEEKVLLTEKELLQAKTDNEKLHSRITSLQNSGNASSLAVKQTQAENKELRQRLDDISKELVTFKKGRSYDSDRIASLEKEIKRLQGELAANIKQRNDYSSLNDSFIKRIANLEKETENLKKENTRLTGESRKLASERKSFAEKINKSQEDLKVLAELKKQNQILTDRQNGLQKQISELEKARLSAKNESANSRNRITNLTNQIRRIEKEKNTANTRIAVLEKEKSLLDTKLASLTKLLSQRDTERTAANTRIGLLEKERDSLNRKIALLSSSQAKKDAENAATGTRLKLLQQEKASLDAKVVSLTGALAAKDAEKTVAETKNAILQKEKASLTRTLAAKDAEKTASLQTIALLKKERDALNKEIAKLNSLRTEKNAADKRLAVMLVQLQEKEKALAKANSDHKQALEKNILAYKKELENAVNKQLKAESALAAALQDKTNLETKYNAANKQNLLLKNEVKNMPGLHVQIRKLTLERDMAQKALDLLKENEKGILQDKTMENARLTTKLAQAQKDILVLEKKAEKLAKAEKELLLLKERSGKLDHVTKQLSALRQQTEKLKETEKRLALLEKEAVALKEKEKALLSSHVKKEQLKETEEKLRLAHNQLKKLKETEEKIVILEKEKTLLKEKLSSQMKTQKLASNEKLMQAEKALEKNKADHLLAETRYKKEIEERSREIILLKSQLKDKENKVVLTEKALTAKISSLEKELKKLSAEKEDIIKENIRILAAEKRNSGKSASETSLLAEKLTKSEELRKTLEREKAKHLARLDKYKKDTLKMRKDMERLVGFHNKALLERNKLASELAGLKGSLKVADEKIMETEKRFLALQKKLDAGSKQHADEMKKTLDSQNESIAALKKVNNEYLIAIGEANIAKERAEKENIQLKEELKKAAEKAIASMKYQEDSKKLHSVEEELSKSKKHSSELLAQIKLLQSNLEKIGKENLSLQTRSEQLGKEYLSLASERDALKKKDAEYTVLKTLSAKQKEDFAALKKEYELLSSRQRELEKENKKNKEQLAKWQNSEDPLVLRMKELLSSNSGNKGISSIDQQVYDELVRQLSMERKKQREALAESVVARNEALRERTKAEKANAAARKAVLDAVRVQSEMTIFKKDIEDNRIRRPSAETFIKAEKAGMQAVALADRALERTTVPVSTLRIPLKRGNIAVRSSYLPSEKKVVASSVAPAKKQIPATPEPAKQETVKTVETVKETKSEKTLPAVNKKYEEAMKQGMEAEKQGDYSMALWHYWQAADAGEKEPAPYLALARLNIKRNEKDAAEKAYQKALQLGAIRDEALEKELKLAPANLPEIK